MATETIVPATFLEGQRRLFAGVFVVLCLALAAGYYLFLRTDYAVLYTGMKPADASAIIAQLDAKGISHRLRDNGTTILVPTDQADNVRLAVAGSDIPMKGMVGFELFNKSDMGLTDFAQKINYQRALQGELARSIMLMDGVETARVHLAIPERSLYRGNRSTPKAAVEILSKLGRPLTPDRVAGIQQLVASAVPELPLSEVAVIDGDGRVVSQAPSSQAVQMPENEEQTAAQNYYRARAKAALGKLMPGLQVDVRTLVLPATDGATAASDDTSQSPAKSSNLGKTADGARNFQLRVTVLTLAPMNADDQKVARDAVAAAVGLDEHHGDNLAFEVGPVTRPLPAPASAPLPLAPVPEVSDTASVAAPARLPGLPDWWIPVLGTLVVLIAIVFVMRGRQPAASSMERDAFVERIRQQLGTVSGDDSRG